MSIPNPERIHLFSLPRYGYWYGNTCYMADTLARNTHFKFEYFRLIRRPHSVSLGASGIVRVDKFWEDENISASVEIIKNFGKLAIQIARESALEYDHLYSQEELDIRGILDEEHTDHDWVNRISGQLPESTQKGVAKLAVMDSLVRYSLEEGQIVASLRSFFSSRND